MSNVLFEIDVNALAVGNVGQVFDHMDIVVVDAAGAPQTVRGVSGTNAAGAVSYTANATLTAPGVFTYTIGAVDSTNAAMGTTVNGSDTIPGGTTTGGVFPQPTGVKVTVS